MTDKQIIIDGVDVSECDYFKNNGKCRIPHYQQNIKYTCCNCSEWNCYYKQLKSKEQECERLKHDNEYEVGALEKTIDNLKAENDLFRTCYDNEQAQRRKYKQTLIEIKEIAEPFCNACQEFEPEKSKNCINCTYCNYNEILQKISKCEVEDEN